MKLLDLIKELESSSSYKDFISKNPSAYICAGFFILDLKNKKDQIQLDVFLPEKKKIAAFESPFSEPKVFDEEVPAIKKLDTEIKVDIDELEDKCEEILKENKTSLMLGKIIAILKEDVWTLTCMNETLGMANIKIDSKTGKVLSFRKGSLMEFVSSEKK